MTMATASTYNEQGKTIWSHAPGVTLVTLAVKLPPRSPTSQLKVGIVTACPPRPRGAEQAGLLKRPVCTAWERSYPNFQKYPLSISICISISSSIIFHHFSTLPISVLPGKRGAAAEKKTKKCGHQCHQGKNGKNARSPGGHQKLVT